MKRYLFLILIFGLSLSCWGQSLQWTSFEHLNDSLRNQPKPILVFIEAEWCKFCKLQDNVTFQDAELVALLNEEFYCLRFDGEGKDDLTFINRTYAYNPSTGYHKLAEILGKKDGKVAFPTTVLLHSNLQNTQRLQGLQPSKYLINDLKLFLSTAP